MTVLRVGAVTRHELPGLHAPGFVLERALGGVTRSPAPGTHGKPLSSSLPDTPLPDPQAPPAKEAFP